MKDVKWSGVNWRNWSWRRRKRTVLFLDDDLTHGGDEFTCMSEAVLVRQALWRIYNLGFSLLLWRFWGCILQHRVLALVVRQVEKMRVRIFFYKTDKSKTMTATLRFIYILSLAPYPFYGPFKTPDKNPFTYLLL